MANPAFDADLFLNQTVDEPLKQEPDLVPPGEYEAIVDKISAKPAKDNDSGINVAIMWEIVDDTLRAQMDRPKIIVPQFMFVVLNESGRIDTDGDKNWRLGQVEKALGVTGPRSLKLLEGRGPARVRISHRTYMENTSAQVDRVVEL